MNVNPIGSSSKVVVVKSATKLFKKSKTEKEKATLTYDKSLEGARGKSPPKIGEKTTKKG